MQRRKETQPKPRPEILNFSSLETAWQHQKGLTVSLLIFLSLLFFSFFYFVLFPPNFCYFLSNFNYTHMCAYMQCAPQDLRQAGRGKASKLREWALASQGGGSRSQGQERAAGLSGWMPGFGPGLPWQLFVLEVGPGQSFSPYFTLSAPSLEVLHRTPGSSPCAFEVLDYCTALCFYQMSLFVCIIEIKTLKANTKQFIH